MTKKEKKIWFEYLSILEQLNETVQAQTLCLQNKEWQKLPNLFGKKENIYLTLKKNEIEKMKNDYQNVSNVIKEKAKKNIASIISIENRNKELIKELMEEIKSELDKLNSKKRMYKLYLNSNRRQMQTGVNLVS